MINLLFVCRYNMDRSPVAELITRHKVGDNHLNVGSAGLRDYKRYPSRGLTDEMRLSLDMLGYNLEKHTNRTITRDLLHSQDLILCMQKSHVNKVLQKEPNLEGKVYTVPEYAGFPDKEIYAPSQQMGEVPAFSILCHMPYWVRGTAYKIFGHSDPRDYRGVISVHRKMIKQIEHYVDGALARMMSEGRIPSRPKNKEFLPNS